eukprot:Nk52_evm6s379 gene=Nk52_evmTU6s379
MLPVTLDKISFKDLTFSSVKVNSKGGKTVYANCNGDPVLLRVPALSLPFGVSTYDQNDGSTRFSLELSFKGFEDNPSVGAKYKDVIEEYHINHLKKYLTQTEEEYNFALKWVAYVVKFPYLLPKVAVVMRGPKGVGKSLFFSLVGKIFGGKHFLHLSGVEQMVTKFNSDLRQCRLCIVDEESVKNERQAECIKISITEEDIVTERKFEDRATTQNFVTYVFISNSAKILRIHDNHERRFFCTTAKEIEMEHDDNFTFA